MAGSHLLRRVPPSFPVKKVAEDTQRKRARALELRKEGLSFQKMADAMGVSKLYARKLYMEGMASIVSEEVVTLRKLENSRLDDMWREAQKILKAFHPYVNSGSVVHDTVLDENGNPLKDDAGNYITVKLEDQMPKIGALNILLKIMERRAKLNGLDMPTKVASTDPTGENPSVEQPAVVFYLPNNERDITPVN